MSRLQKVLKFTSVRRMDVEYIIVTEVTYWWSQKTQCSHRCVACVEFDWQRIDFFFFKSLDMAASSSFAIIANT